MKVCFDGLGLSHLQGTGLNTYSHGLIDSLIRIYSQGSYDIIWDNSPLLKEWDRSKNLVYSQKRLNRLKNDYSALEAHLVESKADVYHSPNNGFSLPQKKVCPFIITVHELIAISNEKYVDKSYSNKFSTVFPEAIKRADVIIAVSNFIKEELLLYFKIPEEKIKVVYPICKVEPYKDRVVSTKNILKYKYNVEGSFILYTGSLHKRKNLRTLITIFKEIKTERKDLKLVIVGKIDGKRETYYNALKLLTIQLDISDAVIFTGTVPHNDLYYFYDQCLCMVNLSEYDGFPISIVEAMKQGTAIICSNIPSNIEVASNGCVLVDQKNPRKIKESILNIAENVNYRESFKDSGRNIGRYYSEEESTKELISIYESFSK